MSFEIFYIQGDGRGPQALKECLVHKQLPVVLTLGKHKRTVKWKKKNHVISSKCLAPHSRIQDILQGDLNQSHVEKHFAYTSCRERTSQKESFFIILDFNWLHTLRDFGPVSGPVTSTFKRHEKLHRESKMSGLVSRENWVHLWLTSPSSQK